MDELLRCKCLLFAKLVVRQRYLQAFAGLGKSVLIGTMQLATGMLLKPASAHHT